MGPRLKAFFTESARALLYALAFGSLAGAIWLGFHDRIPGGSLLAVLGLLLLAFVQLSRFKRFKGIGFEAELWEDKQREAEQIIEQTRALLETLSAAILRTAPRMGRFSEGFSRQEMIDLIRDTEGALKAAGTPPNRLATMRMDIDRVIAFDLASTVTRRVDRFIHDQAEAHRVAVIERFGTPVTDLQGHAEAVARTHAISAASIKLSELVKFPQSQWAPRIRAAIEGIPEVEEAERLNLLRENNEDLLDLEQWAADRTIRRPEVFFNQTVVQ